jgi:hypothetical protein
MQQSASGDAAEHELVAALVEAENAEFDMLIREACWQRPIAGLIESIKAMVTGTGIQVCSNILVFSASA